MGWSLGSGKAQRFAGDLSLIQVPFVVTNGAPLSVVKYLHVSLQKQCILIIVKYCPCYSNTTKDKTLNRRSDNASTYSFSKKISGRLWRRIKNRRRIKVQLFWRLPYEIKLCSKMNRFWVIGDSKKVVFWKKCVFFFIKLFLHTFCQKTGSLLLDHLF